jgi:hypothetical protein
VSPVRRSNLLPALDYYYLISTSVYAWVAVSTLHRLTPCRPPAWQMPIQLRPWFRCGRYFAGRRLPHLGGLGDMLWSFRRPQVGRLPTLSALATGPST